MFRSVMKRSVRYVLLSVAYLPAVALGQVKATADDHAQMIQYELTFAGKQTVSNLYMSMRPAGLSSQSETDGLNTFQMPVISSDPHKTTLLSPLTKLYTNDKAESSDGLDSDTLNPVAGVGAAVIMLAGVAVLLLPYALAVSDATPLRRCSKFRATLSALRMLSILPETVPTISPGLTGVPSSIY